MIEIQNRRGCCISTIDKTERQVLRIMFWSQFVCLVPFWITDWAIAYTNEYSQTCLSESINNLSLWGWLFVDGFVKLLVFFILFIVFLLDIQTMSRSYVSFAGNFLRLFYLFDFAWTVVGSIIFWRKIQFFDPYRPPYQPVYAPVYTFCVAPIQGYIFFLLIFSYIIIPINLYITSLRPISHFNEQILMEQTTQRDTQLNQKPKNIYM